MYINGEKRTVVVDDYFPYNNKTYRWAFSKSVDQFSSESFTRINEIWVLILEKAWAKIYGSYQRIENGTAGEAMYPLTGCPQKQFIHDDIKDPEDFWQRIKNADWKKYPMCCSIVSKYDENVDNQQVEFEGLVDNHAYTLIGAHIIYLDNNEETERLIKIRNPHGRKEWTGDWCDRSELWTPKTRLQVNSENKSDGIFFISFKHFMKFFTTTTICHYMDSCEDNFICDQHDQNQWSMVKFTLERDSRLPLYVTVDQISERFMDDQDYWPPRTKMILTRIKTQIDPKTKQVSYVQ